MKKHSKGTYIIPSSNSGENYKVDIVNRTCTCLHYEYRKTECKHMRTIGMFIYMEYVPVIQAMQFDMLIKQARRCDLCKEIKDGLSAEVAKRIRLQYRK